jgi:CRP-like cAMP-binding protein
MLSEDEQTRELINLFKKGTRLTYKKGEFVIRPGDTPAHVYYIEDGLVKAYNISKYGEENMLIVRKKHEIFPLIWSITGQERGIIYQVLGPTTVWRIGHEEYLSYLQKHNGALSPLLDMVVEMYRLHSERILNLAYRSVRERLISFLLTMNKRFGQKTDEGSLITVPLRHQDIASSINASRETASRELAFLERNNLIINKQSYITLKDVKKLRSFL